MEISTLQAQIRAARRITVPSDGVTFTLGGGDFPKHAGTGRRDTHDSLVGLDFDDVGIRRDVVPGGKDASHDGGLSDGFPELGHDDR
jgi:hypothetical protein